MPGKASTTHDETREAIEGIQISGFVYPKAWIPRRTDFTRNEVNRGGTEGYERHAVDHSWHTTCYPVFQLASVVDPYLIGRPL